MVAHDHRMKEDLAEMRDERREKEVRYESVRLAQERVASLVSVQSDLRLPAVSDRNRWRVHRLPTGASVVPVFIIRQPDMRSHRVEIGDEIAIQRSGDAKADIEENTRRFVRAIEDIVRRYPEQFLWTHRRYRTRPHGMAPIYPHRESEVKNSTIHAPQFKVTH
jgi:Bacterial lipid A biosynthesis acyltransferase